MIVLCSIIEVKRDNSQITGLVVRIIKVLAICGANISGVVSKRSDMFTVEEVTVLKDILKYNILGSIPKPYIYDRQNIRLSLEIDEAKEGMQLMAVIRLVYPKTISGCDLELSLLNSDIHGKEQKPLEGDEHEGRTFYRLGLQYLERKFKLKNSSPIDEFIALDSQLKTYNALDTLVNELGISEFATLKYKEDKMIFQSNLNFDYTKLRDMQNMDWAEESIKYGLELKAHGANPKDLLKYYESAIELDALNNTAHILKGDTLMQLKRIEDAIEAYKIALKLNPNDKETQRKYREASMMLGRNESSGTTLLEEEGYPRMMLIQSTRPNNEGYKMTFG